ncbi:hypothetical protein ILUMI_14715 [Ignelater luminosus]|uniref:Uncharacterized protein n=1 Tax=Ignelater luminosus TaxID=2038154 RepID=A0A8K0CPY5_IGNLU|nr:hypothetical protein ILUMI_14715 [Ignelater luminosus]
MNLCSEYKKNSFGMKDILTKYSNIDPCDLKRGVPYAVNKMILDISRFPPHLPLGSYKVVLKYFFHTDFNGQMDFYMRLLDKPIDWMKIPPAKRSHGKGH